MSDEKSWNIVELKEFLSGFARERDWEKFHTPRNLATALSVEASELLEIFQWLETEDVDKLKDDRDKMEMIRDEVADIMVYLLRFSTVMEIDIPSAIAEKMKKNAEKYPADLVKGSSRKYTEYEK